jgi:tRNA pseudouridine13 synthase
MSLPHWHRAHGEPLFAAQLRSAPDTFHVTEYLGWQPCGEGEHDYLFIEKISTNTEWVARQLADFAGVLVKDVGFAGLKDRHATTRQWFSVPRWHNPDWSTLQIEGVCILEVTRHLRKLRRGAHKANAFRILLSEPSVIDHDALQERIQALSTRGVPNYYGEQRFGRAGGNLKLADEWAKGKRLPRPKRSLAISTIRSFIFNEQLSTRVADATWDQLLPGDKANLEGSGSLFDLPLIDDVLIQRCREMDIHPSITLAGAGSGVTPIAWQTALDNSRVQPGDRSLRLRIHDLHVDQLDRGILISFSLGRGAYATAVLRELCSW